MIRQIFLRRVFGNTLLAIVLLGLSSGCNQTVSTTKDPKPETNTTTETTDPTTPETASAKSPAKTDSTSENKDTDLTKAERIERLKTIVDRLKDGFDETDTPENTTSVKDPTASAATDDNTTASDTENNLQPQLTEEEVIEVIEEPQQIELGEPLVDHPEKLVRLQKDKPAWVDKPGKRVVMLGRVTQRNAPLEMFVCQKHTKEYESVLAVDTTAMAVHTALLLIGADSGHPVQFQPEYKPATGTPIAIEVIWKDADGKIQKAKAQQWIKNVKTGKAMEHDWVFAGSSFWENEETGKRMYLAEQGDFICVSNLPTAMLDLPCKSSASQDALLFQAWKEHIPPLGTPVTIVLTPKQTTEKKTTVEAPTPTE